MLFIEPKILKILLKLRQPKSTFTPNKLRGQHLAGANFITEASREIFFSSENDGRRGVACRKPRHLLLLMPLVDWRIGGMHDRSSTQVKNIQELVSIGSIYYDYFLINKSENAWRLRLEFHLEGYRYCEIGAGVARKILDYLCLLFSTLHINRYERKSQSI